VDLITVYDCMGSNLGHFPVPLTVKMAGYRTGQGGVPWTPAQFAAHPDAIQIDQSPEDTVADELADILDVENQAATMADTPSWVRAAQASYRAAARPGQRLPAVYCNGSTITAVANTLVAAGLGSGVPIWLAAPMDPAAAARIVTSGSGPFPVIGVQFAFLNDHDVSVFNKEWFDNVSGKPPVTNPDTLFEVQVEHYQAGFGWVLDTMFNTPPAAKYRARVSDGQWSEWQEFTP
jgi:hypothetical protein